MLVAGIGNRWRGDDAAGLLVAEQLALLCPGNVAIAQFETPGPELLDLWCSSMSVILVDAVIKGAPPGTLHRLNLLQKPVAWAAAVSSHAFDLLTIVELARVLDRLPKRLVLYGIEACNLEPGDTLSAAVASAIPGCVASIAREIAVAR